MSGFAFTTEVPGKWVLAGEHTVLRGGSAIALPHPEFSLTLEFTPNDGSLTVEPDLAAPVIHALLKVAQGWLSNHGTTPDIPRGRLRITSTIPFGAGLGSSAALSVAIARWVLAVHALGRSSERDLARTMEDFFHGKSSGMDVAVVSLGEPILFSMVGGAIPLGNRRLPPFVFVDSGLRASTRECIAKVNAVREAHPERGEALDREMMHATEEILSGLHAPDASPEDIDRIARGMKRASEVFAAWDLVPEEVRILLERLEKEGMRSPRLTGAGGGGFIVGLRSVADP